ncbi:MAG TPA: glycosyltransferase family 2 protein [Actinomycetota bacterium]
MNVDNIEPSHSPAATSLADRAASPRLGRGPATWVRNLGFRLTVAAMLVGTFLLIQHIKHAIWPLGGHPAHNTFDHVVQWAAVVWTLILPWAIADVCGWMLFRRHTPVSAEARSPDLGRTMSHPVVFRIVSRGDQPGIAIASTWSVLEMMQRRPLFPYDVEVVSDMPIEDLPDHPRVRAIVVPEDYETPKGATHKARALHFALLTSPATDDTWVLHLDEESHVTEELIVGIREAVTQEERNGKHRIGQGLITYHRDLRHNPVYSLADSIRVGDDMGRFHLQYRLHRILFGMHGSFLLVRTSVERQVGFDFPAEACTTEDTTWALHQMAAGNRFRWVDGTVVEQSPPHFKDFVRQRRRWFTGMWWAAGRSPVPWRYRGSLWLAMFLWTVGWTGFLYSLLHVFSGVEIPGPLGMIGDAIFAVYLTNYLLGLWVSLSGRNQVAGFAKAGYFLAQALLIPAFAVIEASAVVYSLVRPERRFHVVGKPVIEVPSAGERAA